MKKQLLLFALLAAVCNGYTQQNMSLSETCSYPEEKDGKAVDVAKKPKIGLLGISGNINTESFEKINNSGKITAFVRPYETTTRNLTLYLSYNKNITRSDTLYLPSLLYPDMGNNAFQATMEYSTRLNDTADNVGHYLVPFGEGWIKDFKVGKTDSSTRRFVTLNYTLGLRYVMHQEVGEDNDMYFSATAYFTRNAILTKDEEVFGEIVKGIRPDVQAIPLKYSSWGMRLGIQYNDFQFYVDGRHVIDKNEKVPFKELRGFNYNIGFITTLNPFSKHD